MRRASLLAVLPSLVLSGQLPAAPPVAADLVLVNGKVWTVDESRPEAEAVAVWRDRLLLVGSSEEVRQLVGPKTRVIDLKERRVLPGFYDSHVHLFGGGLLLSQVNLKDARNEADFGRRLKEFDAKLQHGRWILGGNWDHERTFGGDLPTAALLDKYVPDHPVFIRRYDGHMAVANSKALGLANITADTPNPLGGVIDRLADKKTPSGVLRDNAMALVARLIPAPSGDEVAEGVRAALAEARRCGVTSVQDMDGTPTPIRRQLFRTYQKLAWEGNLTLRIDLRWPIAEAKELDDLGVEADFGGDWLRIGGVKGFIDGSLGSSTAKFFDPYDSDPKNTGVFVTPREELLKQIAFADRVGLSVAIHAIGDRGNSELLDLFAEVARKNGPRDRRFRVEHAQHLRPQDFKRFKELGVIASLQPYHLIDDGRWAEGRIGKKRCATSYANRSLLEAGAKLAFGSDWPVAPLDALVGIDAAVNRRTLDGKHPGGWFPDQKMSVQEAIEAYTLGSAYAAGQEKDRGTLTAGKLADLVVLERDVLDPKERDRIGEARVLMTVVGGKVVYEAKGESK